MKTYTVQKGDTLYGISKKFNTTVEAIKSLNNLTTNTLSIGQQLVIPNNENEITYTVQKGDSLYSIAKKYNTTVNELISLNSLTTTTLYPGETLIIKTPKKDEIEYLVKGGDNLYSIAKKYNTTVEAIKEINNLTSNLLSVGQILKIPLTSQTPNYQEYEVKKGDSLYSIAKKYNTTVESIMNYNNLPTTILTVGQILRIPKITTDSNIIGKSCYGTGYVTPKYETYTVKRGDNLYSIASRFNTTVNNIIKLNNLTSTNLSIGQILKVREITWIF